MNFLHHPVFLKPFQVVVAAVDTTVTLEGVEAPEAVGFEVHTDDVTLLFQSILMFAPRPPPFSPMGHIYPKVLFLKKLKADLKSVMWVAAVSFLRLTD